MYAWSVIKCRMLPVYMQVLKEDTNCKENCDLGLKNCSFHPECFIGMGKHFRCKTSCEYIYLSSFVNIFYSVYKALVG
jgi:hypothetical protein